MSDFQYKIWDTYDYEDALNYNENANVDDGSCDFMMGDLNQDGGINILDITVLINWILEIFN